jgi:hypothetical protein
LVYAAAAGLGGDPAPTVVDPTPPEEFELLEPVPVLDAAAVLPVPHAVAAARYVAR